MTADIREAFNLASVAYLQWRRLNEEQRTWGLLVDENGKRDYDPEPTVEFFGRERFLSEICRYALVVTDDLPPHMQQLFNIIDASGPLIPEKYSEAAEELLECVEFELVQQKEIPIEKPSLVDEIRELYFQKGVSAVLHALNQNFSNMLKAQGAART
ncbi:hypothetical protein J2X36_004408 [Methylobacterium sp. BE186]|uniref:hypothetical protein n=1 Tax=Methylobacterium sp. BE186 TaxID=2817715 RepID=UPI002861E98A|nr:hypothetical protein [Methylobacterium sp. BE186]MDR7039632.1 hypothetical protein [Methylobacterium sp. BE186]